MRFLFLLPFVACGIAAPPPTIVHFDDSDPARFDALVTTLAQEMRRANIPGGSVAVVENGKLVHAAGIGLRDRDEPMPVTPSTRFRIASISKLIVALTAVSLVETGELSLDALVSDYVPGFFAPVTVRQALNHTTGLADAGDPKCMQSADAWLSAYADNAVWAPPGAVWNYGNPNYLIVATVIEHVTGKPLEEVVAERVFVPAGMTEATYDAQLAMAGEHAVQHTEKERLTMDTFDCVLLQAAGGVIASAVDLAHLAEALSAGKVISPASWAMMRTDVVDTRRGAGAGYGLGVFTSVGLDGQAHAQHGGGMPGLQTLLVMIPDEGFAVVTFFNGDVKTMGPAVSQVLRTYRGTTTEPPPRVTPPPAMYAGRYRDAVHGLVIEVSEDGGGLLGAISGDTVELRSKLEFVGGDTFLLDWPVVGTTSKMRIEATFFPDGYLVTRAGVASRE